MTDEPTEGLHDPTKFVAPEFPWMLAPAPDEDGETVDMADVLRLSLSEPRGPVGVALPVFSDADLAERFAEGVTDRAGPLDAFQSPRREWMAELLDLLSSQGVTHVCYDPGTGGRIPGPVFTVAEFAAHYRR